MGSESRSLKDKRILITDVENDFGKELYTALRGEGCLVFTFVKESCRMQQVMKDFPEVNGIILNPNLKDGLDEGYKLLSSLPTLDHIINLSGDLSLDIISKAYASWKIQDFGENKTKPLISKMKDSGNRGLIFHSSVGNQNLMSKLKANLNPRYTDSATAQVSTSVRKSFKRLFTSSTVTPTPAASTSSSLSQTIAASNSHATEFAAVASSLSRSTKEGSPSSSTPSPRATPTPSNSNSSKNPRFLTASQKNDKIRESVNKLNNKTVKKWNKLLKNMEKQQLSQLKNLDKEINRMKKKEKISLMNQNAQANASTVARTDVLSADTANRIMASREARVDREVEKKADNKRDEDTQKLAEDKQKQMEDSTLKLYHKIITKQITEFNKLKQKHLII